MKQHPIGKELPDDVSQYKSPSTGEYVMAHQYIAELMVARKAKQQGKDLPYKYWNDDNEWAKEFRSQVSSAAQLLKKYSVKAIIKAILNIKWAYSLRAKKLLDEIEKQQKIIDHENTLQHNINVVEKPEIKEAPVRKVSLLGRLKRLNDAN